MFVPPRWIDPPLVCSRAVCLVLRDGRRLAIPGDAVHVTKDRVLSSWDGRFFITEISTGTSHQIPIGRPFGFGGGAARHVDIIAIGPTIVDVGRESVLGEVPRPAIEVDIIGRALVPSATTMLNHLQSGQAWRSEVRMGPLRWVTPLPMTREQEAAILVPKPAPVEIVATDATGTRLDHVRVTVSEQLWSPESAGTEGGPAHWRWLYPDLGPPWAPYASQPDGMAVDPPDALAAAGAPTTDVTDSNQYLLPQRTDMTGALVWHPHGNGPYSVMAIADDGRVGAADAVRSGDHVQIELRPRSALHIVCDRLPANHERLGGIEIVSGARKLKADCDDVIEWLPRGHYTLTMKFGLARYAKAEVDVVPGRRMLAVMRAAPMAIITLRAVEYPGDKPVGGAQCQPFWRGAGYDYGGDSWGKANAAGVFTAPFSQGQVLAECTEESGELTRGQTTIELRGPATTTVVRMVRHRDNAVGVGVEIAAELDGARIQAVGSRAARAGLLAGDLVTAVEGVMLAGLGVEAMQALAFEFPPEQALRWTVVRDGKSLTIDVPPFPTEPAVP